jgi:hypothetical protein
MREEVRLEFRGIPSANQLLKRDKAGAAFSSASLTSDERLPLRCRLTSRLDLFSRGG